MGRWAEPIPVRIWSEARRRDTRHHTTTPWAIMCQLFGISVTETCVDHLEILLTRLDLCIIEEKTWAWNQFVDRKRINCKNRMLNVQLCLIGFLLFSFSVIINWITYNVVKQHEITNSSSSPCVSLTVTDKIFNTKICTLRRSEII